MTVGAVPPTVTTPAPLAPSVIPPPTPDTLRLIAVAVVFVPVIDMSLVDDDVTLPAPAKVRAVLLIVAVTKLGAAAVFPVKICPFAEATALLEVVDADE